MDKTQVIKIPVIVRSPPAPDTIKYNGKLYGISSPRIGLENVGYPDLKKAMMYAHNWRRSKGYLSLVVSITSGKTTRYFVYAHYRGV